MTAEADLPDLPQAVQPPKPVDWAAAVQSLLPAAKTGDAAAQARLAHAFLNLGLTGPDPARPVHFAQALFWAKKSAAQGHAFGQYNVAIIYDAGLGIAANKRDAFRHYRLAAEQGHAAAQYGVGKSYLVGDSVTQNYAEARAWLMKAGAQNESHAQYALGLMDERGQGGPPDAEAAVTWYRRAADQGLSAAQVRLAGLYATGHDGRAADNLAAYFWYCVAVPRLTPALQPMAVANRDRVAARLTADAVKRAQTLAAVWTPGAIDSIEAELRAPLPTE